jgi:hypothetical protein
MKTMMSPVFGKVNFLVQKPRLAAVVLGFSLFMGGVAIGQTVNPARHPNLAAAQRLCRDAYDKLVMAQQANEYDMGGHAQKAKEHLEQANNEIKMAAGAANK